MTRGMSSPPVRLVIFDKDGTLVDFHKMWMPWARSTVEGLVAATGVACGETVYKTLGVDPVAEKVSMGALAEKTLTGIRADISLVLQKHFGFAASDADAIVSVHVPEAATGRTEPVCPLLPLMKGLKQLGCKIAVCTADSRRATEQQMKMLGISDMLDDIVCGNDVGIVPKPSPHCAVQICKRLGVELNEAVMVGDTIADLKMGRVAGLRASVAVLTGVGTRDTLKEYTDYYLPDVSGLPQLIEETINSDSKRG